MSRPEVTVVVTTYGGGRGLPRALQSAVSQSVSVEVIVVIDGEPTDPQDIAAIRTLGPPHRVVRLQRSGRPGPGRSAGLSQASAPLVAFLDDDDEFMPGKLIRQMSWLETPRRVLVGSDALRVSGGKTLGSFEISETRVVPLRDLIRSNVLVTSTVTAKTDHLRSVGGFPVSEEYRYCDDYVAWLRVAAVGQVGVIGEPLSRYSDGDPKNLSLSGHDPMSGAETRKLAVRTALGDFRTFRMPKGRRLRRYVDHVSR